MGGNDEFDAVGAARSLLRTGVVGSLATLSEDGTPFCSLIECAGDASGAPVTLLSTLAIHTQNLLRDARASIMLDQRVGKGPVLTRARISLSGRMSIVAHPGLRERFLAHHPEAAMYADFGDFDFWHFNVSQCHLVAGFGRIVDIAPEVLLVPVSQDLQDAEADIIAHMNEDHRETMALYGRHFAGVAGGDWSCAGIDTLGLSQRLGDTVYHIPFDREVTSPGVLRQVLKQMADTARCNDAG